MADDKTPHHQLPEGDLPASIAPIEAIMEEAAKFEKLPDQAGILEGRPLNDVIDDSLMRPRPKTHCRGLIVEGENTVLFASTNVGKSIACYQMAEQICRDTGEVVDYLDFELSDMHLMDRYTDADTGARHYFPANLHRYEISPDLITDGNVEEAILASIEQLAQKGDRFFFVDNLTFICRDSEKGLGATEFMMRLIKLRRTYDLTLVVIAHTPKRDGKQPISPYDLAGSSKLISFFDAGIAIGRSVKDKETRYIKQVKVRHGQFEYGADNVITCEITKDGGYAHFRILGTCPERDHLKERTDKDIDTRDKNIKDLYIQGKSYREIADILNLSKSLVGNVINKLKEKGLLSSVQSSTGVDNMDTVDTSGQEGPGSLFDDENTDNEPF